MKNKCIFKNMILASLFVLVMWGCNKEDSSINSPGAGDRWIFTKSSGDNQSLSLHDTLSQRLTVELKMLNGTPIKNESILFKLVQGNGNVFKPAASGENLDLRTITDFEGKASAQFRNFGPGSGFSKVSAQVISDTTLVVIFTINSI